MKSALLLLVLSSVSCCLAQVPGFGPCNNVTTKENFEASKYLGKWYESERYFAIFEAGGKCVTAVYGQGDNGTITVLNSQINYLTGSKSNISGVATPNPNNPAKLTVRFPGTPDGAYWVIDTDYDNYSVVWSCTSVGGIFNAKFSWILTRERQPKLEVMQNAYRAIDRNGISRAFYLRTNQQNCPSDS